MKVLAISHVPHEGLDSYETVLRQRGAQITAISTCYDDVSAIDPAAHDVAVILGGPMGVYQGNIFPSLPREIDYIAARAAQKLPTFGICLGSQLMAAALGAKVYPGKAGQEIGWHPLHLTAAGEQSCARHLSGDKSPMLHWHGDTFDLPHGVTLLASSDKYAHQIYEWEGCLMGVQCHPEVTARSLETWIAAGGFEALEKMGQDVNDFRAQIAANAAAMQMQCALFFNEWLDKVSAQQKAA